MKDGAELKEDSRVVVNRDFAPHGSYEITIHKVGDADAGQYTAIASNTVGKEECSCQVSKVVDYSCELVEEHFLLF